MKGTFTEYNSTDIYIEEQDLDSLIQINEGHHINYYFLMDELIIFLQESYVRCNKKCLLIKNFHNYFIFVIIHILN